MQPFSKLRMCCRSGRPPHLHHCQVHPVPNMLIFGADYVERDSRDTAVGSMPFFLSVPCDENDPIFQTALLAGIKE